MKTTTIQLFNLFYKSGLLEHTKLVDTMELMDTMNKFEGLRSGRYFECIRTNKNGEPVAHVAGSPTHNDNVWILSQHCSIVPGQGFKVLEDVMWTVMDMPEIEYIIGGYNPINDKAKRIWDLCYEMMGDTDICDRALHNLTEGLINPVGHPVPLFVEAFGRPDYEIIKFLRLFSRPTGYIPPGGKSIEMVIFKVCDYSKAKFKELFK